MELQIPLRVKEINGIRRIQEPITIGIPFSKGKVERMDMLCLSDQKGTPIPFSADILATWSDGSPRWILFDFQASVAPFSEAVYHIGCRKIEEHRVSFPSVNVEEKHGEFIVRTGEMIFFIDKTRFMPFKQILAGGLDIISPHGSRIILSDSQNTPWMPCVTKSTLEDNNGLRARLSFEGIFSNDGRNHVLRFRSYLQFYWEHSLARIDFTIWNPEAAKHPGGLWDLGDDGSVIFQDLSFEIQVSPDGPFHSKCCVEPGSEVVDSKDIRIYQDSSGGKNWKSKNHVNRFGQIPISFKGYEIRQSDRTVKNGLRATPIVGLTSNQHSVVGTMRFFWQNFPASIETIDNCLRISPFPKYFNDQFELQGGEQKTYRVYLNFSREQTEIHSLYWIHFPLVPQLDPEYNCSTGVFPYVIPKNHIADRFPFKDCIELTWSAIEGEHTFVDRREIIDEYGWRNFGDVYADHENLLYDGEKPVISHYNNQYDLINSFIFQYVRSGDTRWFVLAEELAFHVMDIDIYHTDKDRYEYNHGLFWHTDHYTSAATATHRSYSRQTMIQRNLKTYGGGTSYQHLYSQGLLSYYYLTGDSSVKDAVLELAAFAVKGVEGPDRAAASFKHIVKKVIRRINKILNPRQVSAFGLLEGPGRASGNVLSVLLDAFLLARDIQYLSYAERLIGSCVHPTDDIAQRNLLDPNFRWPYTIFFQSVGKYLDIKYEMKEFDSMFFYAKESLLRYAKWMCDNEEPFLQNPEALDFPNYATRAATDIRKNNVLQFAARYSTNPLSRRFSEKANFFFDNSMNDLLSLETRTLTRPLAILMQNMNIPLYFSKNTDERIMLGNKPNEFEKSKNTNAFKSFIRNNLKSLTKLLRK